MKKTVLTIVLLSITQSLNAETLEQAWATAIANNHRIKAAQANTAVYDQQLYAAEGQALPSVNLSAGYNQLSVTPSAKAQFSNQSSRFPTAQDGSWQGQAMVSVPVYTSGMITHNVRAAEAALDAAKQNQASVILTLKMQVAESYLGVLRAESALQVAQSHIEAMNSHRQDAENRFAQGVVARNDVLAANVEQANAQQRVVQLTNQLDIARSHYNQLLNRKLTSTVNLVKQFPKPPADNLTKLTVSALRQRPELTALSEQINSLEQQAESVNSALLPQVSLNGGYQYQQNRYQVYEGMWQVGVGMQWKLFDGSTAHKSDAIVKQALALKEQYNELATSIELQVRQAWLEMQETQQRITVAKQAIEQATENMKVSTDRYQQGLATNTDLLKAEDLRTLAYDNFNNASYDFALASLHLRYALGVL